MRVIAIDPGKLCGWAAADIDENGEWGNLTHGILPAKEMVLKLHELQVNDDEPPEFDIIIYENWTLFRDHVEEFIGSDMPYSQTVGQIRFIGWLSHTRVVKSEPHMKTNARKSLRAWWPEVYGLQQSIEARSHKDAHDGDAILHLWAWTRDNFNTRKHT